MIPGIGSLIAGITHIAMGLNTHRKNWTLIGRGIAEIVAGPVVAIFDIVATAGRLIKVSSDLDLSVQVVEQSNFY